MLRVSLFRRLSGNYDLVLYLDEQRRRKQGEIERLRLEIEQLQLAHARNVRDLVSHFHSALQAEEDLDWLAETLEEGLRDMNDSVCRLEEHVLD